MKMELPSEQHVNQLARKVAACLMPGMVLAFSGEMGTGKTTFIRALLRTLSIEGPVKSPTYSLVESYECPNFILHHFDLYRIADEAELEYMGFREYFSDRAVCCIEWPERAPRSIVSLDLHFFLTMNEPGRIMNIEVMSVAGKIALSCMQVHHE